MNTKNNRRRRESVERIQSVFIALLQERELNEITVSDICKRCGLNRSTFYANFEDIYALADSVRRHLEEEVAGLYAPERSQGHNSNDFLKLFRHIQEHPQFYRTYFKLGYDDDHSAELYDVHMAAQRFNNQHISYHIAFFKSGLNAIVKMWLANGCRESPEEINEIISSEYHSSLCLDQWQSSSTKSRWETVREDS